MQDVGALIQGRWEPDAAERDSRATWRIERGDRLTTLRLRLPWGLLLFADPSSRTAYAPKGGKAVATVVNKVATTLVAEGRTVRFDIGWDEWNAAKHVERPKRGIEQVGQELARYAG